MNYYAQGGQAHGLKALAQELPKYGRMGDTMVAHINPEEAALLKSLGGSGTINPHTGLPEFGLGSFFKAVTAPIRAVYDVTLKNIPGVDKALVGLDKGIGSIIPGGWGTLASIAGSAVGLPTWALTGLGALTGSGALKKDGKFNLQGALLGGAMAYGASQIGQGLAEAGGGANPTASDVAGKLGVEGASTAPGSQAAMLAEQNAGLGMEGLRNIGSSAQPAIDAARATMSNADVYGGLSGTAGNVTKLAPQSSYVGDLLSSAKNSLAAEGAGIKNLVGLGDTSASAAAANFTKPITTGGMTALTMGTLGTMQLDEQQKYLDQQLAAGNVSQAEYNAEAARIADAKARAERAVRENPYQFAKGGEVPGYAFGGVLQAITPDFIEKLMSPEQRAQSQAKQLGDMGIKQSILDTATPTQIQDYINAMRKSEVEKSAYRSMINNPYQYAVGGSVDDESGMDEARGLSPGNMQNGFMNGGSTPVYAMGGNVSTPRFLSGGGDGMSDSIPATINGKQEARLADGEFVVPADVVSHLGNGSSKAGAQRLYSMMDKVRSARTGTKKQAPAINARKLMPA